MFAFFPLFFFNFFFNFLKGNNFKETVWTWSGDFVVTAQQVIKSGTAPSPDPVVQVILERKKNKKEPFAFRTWSEQLHTSFIARRHNTSGRPNGRRRFNRLFAAFVLSWLPAVWCSCDSAARSETAPPLQVQGRHYFFYFFYTKCQIALLANRKPSAVFHCQLTPACCEGSCCRKELSTTARSASTASELRSRPRPAGLNYGIGSLPRMHS